MARGYDAPRRRAQADATRERILSSAHELFAAHGYAATPIARVAARAGVSDRFVYSLFGSKRKLLFALLEHFAPSSRDDVESETASADGPAAQLAVTVHFVTDYYAKASDLLTIAIPAAASDADLQAFVEQGEAFRRLAQRPLVDQWAARGELRYGLTASTAADLLWAMTGPEVYLKLAAAGWTKDQIRAWLTQMLGEALLREGRGSPH